MESVNSGGIPRELMRDGEDFARSMGSFFFSPYPWQREAVPVVAEKNTTLIISSNKIGKTALVANIAISWCLGYEPWTGSSSEKPGYVEVGGVWYHPSSLGMSPPVNIIIVGESWETHIKETLVPELKRWAPDGWYTTRRNQQGVEAYWEWMNGSKLTIMCYTQEDKVFESFRGQGAIFDEPPPKKKVEAVARGMMLDQGKMLFSLTPLSEVWIYDDYVLTSRRDVGVIDGLCITDNPDLYGSDVAVLVKMGLTERQVERFFEFLLWKDKERGEYVDDKGAAAEKYLEEVAPGTVDQYIGGLKILRFVREIDPSDVGPRLFGVFRELVGRVIPEFNRDIHLIEPFEVSTGWPVVPMVDFHLSTPQAISYWATSENDLNFGVREVWEHYDAAEIADDIIRQVRTKGWLIKHAYIDPLSKGDTGYMKNRVGTDVKDTFTILEGRLKEQGIKLHVGSKDKVSGIRNIKTALRGPNKIPTTFLFNTLRRHLYEVSRWVYDDGVPKKENDHFMENWYRHTLTGTRWIDYHRSSTYQPISTPRLNGPGGWMGV